MAAQDEKESKPLAEEQPFAQQPQQEEFQFKHEAFTGFDESAAEAAPAAEPAARATRTDTRSTGAAAADDNDTAGATETATETSAASPPR